jgi:hypothetical protein
MPVISATSSGSRGRRIANSKPAQAKLVRPCHRNKIQIKGLRNIAQEVRDLPSMYKVLGLIPNITHKQTINTLY